MWETIVLNLLSNAFKFTFSGSITVASAVRESDLLEVSITDTGTGIEADELEQLFERFYRPRSARGRTAEGSGIGLALVRNLVELHGGTIQLDSTPGSGTRVSIRLPAAPASRVTTGLDTTGRDIAHVTSAADSPYVAEALQWLDAEGADADVDPAQRPLILVADDNADMRRHLHRVLGARWNTKSVGDGSAALEFIRAHRPDLLITDVMMPALDGFGLVATIRADEELATLPVIILSARAGTEATAEGLAAGADDYLVKPFSSRDLLSRVGARLEVAARTRRSSGRQERGADQMRAIVDLSTALAGANAVPDVVTALLESPIASLSADAAAVAVLEPTADLIRVTFAGDLSGEFSDRYHVVSVDAPVPTADVIRTGKPMVVGDRSELGARYVAMAADAGLAVRAFLLEPLRGTDGAVSGALLLSWTAPRVFQAGEVELAGRVAGVLAQAVERIKISEREHRIATELQERLLDLELRSTRVVVSATYQPAGELLRVGGDWYTATTLDDHGRVGVSVGDVVGHGLEGATAMSQLRSALGAAALTSTDPSEVIDLLDGYATRVSGAACGTVAYAVIDPEAASVRYACAGHPYPLLVGPDGAARFLEEGRRRPLASNSLGSGGRSGSADLPTGALLLLYTDGLIERRGESLDDGFSRLANVATTCLHLPAGEVCATLLERMAPPAGYPDDVALVAVRPTGTTSQSFVSALPADARHTPEIRHRLRTWLRDCAFPPDEHLVAELLVGVGEALVNAIEHGSRSDAKRIVWLEVFAQEQQVVASVSDCGRWDTDSAASRRESSRGRGLTLIHGLSDDVKTVRTILGTRVVMTFRTRPDTGD